jgi:DNA-binding LacI/PurR family transcriptional regulator
MLRQYSVDGVIVASSTLPESFAQAFVTAGVPVVHSFGRHSPEPTVNILGIDNIQAGKLAAEALIARGYKKIGFLGGPKAATSTQDRMEGFLAAILQHPNVASSVSFADAYSFEAGRAEMLRLMDTPLADAYFCGDDVLSIGALSALHTRGISVPKDVGIIGLNDMEMAAWDNIDLTTIHNPIADIIAASVNLVADLVQDNTAAPEAHLFACHVVDRGTLRPL